MKKIVFVLFIIFIGIICITIFFKLKGLKKQESNYNSKQLSSSENSFNTAENSQIENNNNLSDNNSTDNNSSNNSNNNSYSPNIQKETLISEFKTKIYTKDKERQNNINITCSTLNNTYVDPGKTFSFCNTVGKATSSKGYKKADVFQNGEVIQALGGGNCQVSTTLYNAVLRIPEFKVTERHKHSNTVPYISKGKDAAVSFGTYDFKFVNNFNNTIKITSSTDKKYVYIKIFKLE